MIHYIKSFFKSIYDNYRRDILGNTQRANSVRRNKRDPKIYTVDGKLHRLDGPAQIDFYRDGGVHMEQWYYMGKRHRINGPSFIAYFRNGVVNYEIWEQNGIKHRDDGPADIIRYNNGRTKIETWVNNGIISNLFRPSIIKYKTNGDILEELWIWNETDITLNVLYWLESNNLNIPKDWRKWSDDDRFLFKMSFDMY